MEFIDHNGHIFSLPSYKTYPVGYEYDEQPYIFWLNDNKKLSTSNYYIKPIRFILDEDKYAFDENTSLCIELNSNYYKLMGSCHLNNLLNKSKNLFDYLTISSDILYWEEGNYESITKDNKPGYVKFDLLKDKLTEEDIIVIQHLDGEYGEKFSMITFYVVGYSDTENVMLNNILISITENNITEFCPITVGGEFFTENESLIINGKNMGIDLPKDIIRAVYQSSFYNYSIDNDLYNLKLKELLLNYMNIKGECGNYNSALSAFKWFGWGDKISINKLLKTDNEFVNQYIVDSFDITNDILYSYKYFKNTTYIKLNIFGSIESNEYNKLEWDSENEFWGEGNPKIHELVNDNKKVVYEESDLIFYKQYYDFCFEELGLKLSALEYYYKKYFLPIHIFIHSASISYQCFMNPNKLIVGENKTLYSEKPILIGDVFHNNDTSNMLDNTIVTFQNNHNIIYYTQTHFIDKNFNEFTKYILHMNDYSIYWNENEYSNALWNNFLLNSNYNLFWVNENCLSIPISFKQRQPIKTSGSSGYEYYNCKLLLEKIDKSLYNFLYTFDFSIDYYEAFSLNFIDINSHSNYDDILISHKLFDTKSDSRSLYKTDKWSDYMSFNEFKEFIKTNYFDYLKFNNTVSSNSDDIILTISDLQLNIKIKSINKLKSIIIDNINYIDLTSESIIDDIHNIIYETSFSFIQYLDNIDGKWCYRENTLYKNFVIIPKILGQEYNINFWLNNEFNIYLNVNGHWFTYNFNCILPELQMNIGKLEYKYYLDIEDSYRNQFGDISFFKQLNSLSNTNIVFNNFMWQPELVQVNNIDFFSNLLDYYKTYHYNIKYNDVLTFYPNKENILPEISVNDLYYVFCINDQKFYIDFSVINQYFINENNKSFKLPLNYILKENQSIKNELIAIYNDEKLAFVPVYNENNLLNYNDTIDYPGSSGVFNIETGELNENYLILSENGKTLVFNTIYNSEKDTMIYNAKDNDEPSEFIIIMEEENTDNNIEDDYVNIYFEIDKDGIISLYLYDTNDKRHNLPIYSAIYHNKLDLYNKYKEFPNIINNSSFLNRVHLYDIYKNGKLFIDSKDIYNTNNDTYKENTAKLYNIFFNQDEQITSKINIPGFENIYDLYIMKTPYDEMNYQFYSLFISKLTLDKYNNTILDINDYRKEFTLNNHIGKLTYIEKNETNSNKYGYYNINKKIIDNILLKEGIQETDLYIVFNTTLKVKVNDTYTDNELSVIFNQYLCDYLINSIYNINIGFEGNTVDIGLFWNVNENDAEYGGIHWATIPLHNIYCPYCGKINTLYYIGNNENNENIDQYKCAYDKCAAYIGNPNSEIVNIENASTVYWNDTLKYSIPYKLLYTLSDDMYSEVNPNGCYHTKQVEIPDRYMFSLNNISQYISYDNNSYSYIINNDSNKKVKIYADPIYTNYENMEWDELRETYIMPNVYSYTSNSYYNIDFINGLDNEYYNYYTYINDIVIYSKNIYNNIEITNSINDFYLLYDLKNNLYTDSWILEINQSTEVFNENEIINIYQQSNGNKLTWYINDNYKYNSFNPKTNSGNYIFTTESNITSDDYYIKLLKENDNYLNNDLYIRFNTSLNDYLYLYIGNYNSNNNILNENGDINININYQTYVKNNTGIYEEKSFIDILTHDPDNINIYIKVNDRKINIGTVSEIKNTIVNDNKTFNENYVYTINTNFIKFTENDSPESEKIYLDTFNNLFILIRYQDENGNYLWGKKLVNKISIYTPANITAVESNNTLYSINKNEYYSTDYVEVNTNNDIIRKVIHNINDDNLWYLVNNTIYEQNINNPDKWKNDNSTEVLLYINDSVNIDNKKWYYTINGIEYEYTGSLNGIETMGNNYININLKEQGEEPIYVKLNFIKGIKESDEYYDNIDYYTFKHVKSENKFLINRFDFIPTNGKNHFTNNDIIVANISPKMNKDGVNFALDFKLDYGSKWEFIPISLKSGEAESIKSTTEMGIISIGDNNIKYEKGYYNIICKYSIDGNTQNVYLIKSRILVK